MDKQLENWDTGDAYERFMGRWSREVAIQFVKWLNVSPSQSWLDLGCGTGALSRAIIQYAQPGATTGLDPSLDFVRYARQHAHSGHFVSADGSLLPFADKTFDALVSGLALNFIPKPERALAEMRRVVNSTGVVAAYVWDYADKMEFLRYFWDAAAALDAGALSVHEGKRFPICRPDALRQLWHEAGLHDISVEAIDIPTIFENFERYWKSFLLGSFPAPKYVSTLADEQKNALRDYLQSVIPIEEDGSIHLIARVWALRGYC